MLRNTSDTGPDMQSVVTFDDVVGRFTDQAAKRVAGQYGRYLVTTDDCKQEIYCYLYSKEGERFTRQRLNREPQQLTRIRYKLVAVAKAYAEKQKAEKVGYDVSDIHWYTTTQITALMPLALDESFAGTGSPDYDTERVRTEGPKPKKNPAELGDLTALVLDVRRAIDKLDLRDQLAKSEPGDTAYDQAVEAILQYLGGVREYIGRRKIFTNSEAQAVTSEGY